MNPYYAVGFICALSFWVWPGIVYKTLAVDWWIVMLMAALIFLGLGRAATEFDMRFIAPRKDLQQKKLLFAVACILIVFIAALPRQVHLVIAR